MSYETTLLKDTNSHHKRVLVWRGSNDTYAVMTENEAKAFFCQGDLSHDVEERKEFTIYEYAADGRFRKYPLSDNWREL